MSVYVKPIQPTPTLSGEDAKKIIDQVLVKPSVASVDRHKKLLDARKRAQNK